MKWILGVVAVAAAVITGFAVFRPAAPIEGSETPLVTAAMFYSDWCASCRILEPKLKTVRPDYADKPVRFVKYDFTLGPRPAHRQTAEEEGMSKLYEEHKGGTGFMVLIDRNDGELLDVVTMRYSEDEIRNALNGAITTAALN